jgi:hypothetical protein
MKWTLCLAPTLICFSASAQTTTATIPAVTNNPVTLQRWTVYQIPQSDGSIQQLTERIDFTRASDGSTRNEKRILSGSGTGAQLQATGTSSAEIRNITTRLSIHLDPDIKLARVSSIKPSKNATTTQPPPVGATQPSPPQPLGTQQIAGYTVSGTRTVYLYPKGTTTPTQDVTQTIDSWYSPDLQLELARTVSDTLGNVATTTVSGIATAEPDPSLFQSPPDYASKANSSFTAH